MMPASVAERIAYGRPVDPEVAEAPIVRVVPRPGTALLGRLLLASIFLFTGLSKLVYAEDTARALAAHGVPRPLFFAVVAGLAELAGGLAIATGFLARVAALGLVVFLIPATVMFHAFWNLEGAERYLQLVEALKNLTIIGGLTLLVAYGAGRYSVDALLRRPMQP